jgi:hypothetical protein
MCTTRLLVGLRNVDTDGSQSGDATKTDSDGARVASVVLLIAPALFGFEMSARVAADTADLVAHCLLVVTSSSIVVENIAVRNGCSRVRVCTLNDLIVNALAAYKTKLKATTPLIINLFLFLIQCKYVSNSKCAEINADRCCVCFLWVLFSSFLRCRLLLSKIFKLASASLPATCYELPLMIDDVFSSSFIPFILLPILFSIPSFGPIRTFGVKVQIKLIESRKVQKGVCRCVLYVGRNVYRVSVS